MIGLLLKDLYTLRQYGRNLLLMLIFFAVLSAGMDNPATLFDGFVILMSMMVTITSFSYDSLAKWERFALSLPVSRKEIVASKYLLSIVLGLSGAIISFLISSIVLMFFPVEGFGINEHLLMITAIMSTALFFTGILLPLIFQFGVEKSRIFMLAICAVPTAAVVALDKMGGSVPNGASLMAFAKLVPFIIIVFYLLSFLISVKIFTSKEF